MKQPFLLRLLFSITILFTIWCSVACEKKNDKNNQTATGDTIKVGSYYPLTGDLANFGTSSNNGIQLAISEINDKGGLLGKKVELLAEDDRGMQQEATSAVQKLIDKDRVLAILGEAVSTNSIAGGQVCQEKGVPMITPSSTNPQVTQIGEFIFRTCFLDDFQGEVMARFAANTLKVKKVTIFCDNGNDYSLGLSKFFKENFEKLGGEILSTEYYQKNDPDFSAQLAKIGAAKPEAIYVPGYYTQVGQIAQQARRLGVNVPLLGGDGWDAPTLLSIGKEALNNCYFSNHYTVEDTDEVVQTFVKKYKAKFGDVPDSAAALGYDSGMILFDAIKRANSTDRRAIRDAIAQTKDFIGVTGKITIGPKRDAVKSAVIVGIEDGHYKAKEKMSPTPILQ